MKRKRGNKYMNATPTVHAGKPMPDSWAVGRAETRQDAEGLEAWGSRLVKMTIFFDNVFRIPATNQRGKFCIACRQRATYVQLDNDGEPLA